LNVLLRVELTDPDLERGSGELRPDDALTDVDGACAWMYDVFLPMLCRFIKESCFWNTSRDAITGDDCL
jgi:hypothetical protein